MFTITKIITKLKSPIVKIHSELACSKEGPKVTIVITIIHEIFLFTYTEKLKKSVSSETK